MSVPNITLNAVPVPKRDRSVGRVPRRMWPSAEADFVATFFYPTLPCRAFLLRPFGAGVRRSNPAQFINCEWKWIRKHRTR